ncbi:hypothetical protein [Streptomyces sp. NPDC049915]
MPGWDATDGGSRARLTDALPGLLSATDRRDQELCLLVCRIQPA